MAFFPPLPCPSAVRAARAMSADLAAPRIGCRRGMPARTAGALPRPGRATAARLRRSAFGSIGRMRQEPGGRGCPALRVRVDRPLRGPVPGSAAGEVSSAGPWGAPPRAGRMNPNAPHRPVDRGDRQPSGSGAVRSTRRHVRHRAMVWLRQARQSRARLGPVRSALRRPARSAPRPCPRRWALRRAGGRLGSGRGWTAEP